MRCQKAVMEIKMAGVVKYLGIVKDAIVTMTATVLMMKGMGYFNDAFTEGIHINSTKLSLNIQFD